MDGYKKMYQIYNASFDGCNGVVEQPCVGELYSDEDIALKQADKMTNSYERYYVEQVYVPDLSFGLKKVKPTYRAFGKVL